MSKNGAAVIAVLVVVVGIAGTTFAASWVGCERARQSVECIKAGGEWADSECRKGTGR